MKLTLINKKQETNNIFSFFFQPDSIIEWQAGQYLRYHLTDPQADERGENRFFSIASAPFEKQIQLTTRIDPEKGSSFKKHLLTLKPGDEIAASGPNGAFIVEDPTAHFIFIAGGIGITPFRSIILDLHHKNLPINVNLFYANRTPEVLFQTELDQISTHHSEFKIHYLVGGNTLTPQLVQKLDPQFLSSLFYISGPEPMVTSFEKSFIEIGVSEEKIKHDYFPGYSEY